MSPKDGFTIVEKSLSDSSLASTPTAATPRPLLRDTYFNTLEQPVWVRLRQRYQAFLSELLGTFIFLLLSFGVTAQVTLSEGKNGDWTTLCLGWGFVLPSCA